MNLTGLLHCGANRDRTDDLLNAIQALSQLSYSPDSSTSASVRRPWGSRRRRKRRSFMSSSAETPQHFSVRARFSPSTAPPPLLLPGGQSLRNRTFVVKTTRCPASAQWKLRFSARFFDLSRWTIQQVSRIRSPQLGLAKGADVICSGTIRSEPLRG